MICSRGYEAFVSGVSLGERPGDRRAAGEDAVPHPRREGKSRDRREDVLRPAAGFCLCGVHEGAAKGICAEALRQLWALVFAETGSDPTPIAPEPAPGQDGKTCREIGASSSFRSKVENNDVWKVHQRAYKKYFARIRSGLMTKGEFEVWSRQAAELRDAALKRYAQAESEEERQRIAQEVAAELNAE